MARETTKTQDPAPEATPAPAVVCDSFPDEDWRERIARAKQERQEARKARQNKPLTFRTRYGIR